MQGGGHNEYEDWATIQVYPGTSLEQVLIDYVAEHGEPTKNGFVWSGIWRCDYDEMPERDCKAVSIMWEYNYYIDVHPESDEYFTIDWVSTYWKGYWRPQDRWTIKTEVVKQGTLITLPADPEMPSGHADEYNFIGWTGLPADNIMPRRNLTITANWEEAMVKAYVVWNMAIPQSDGTVSYREHFRREIDMSTAQYTGAQAAVGAWPSAPVGDQTMEFVMWTQPYSDTQTPSQWLPMSAADNYSIYYDAQNQTQEYLIGTALMQSLTWDSGRLNGYSRVYWRVPSLIRHYTGYVHYEWTTWKFFYVKNGSVINTPAGTPANVFDYEGVENNFVEWPSHATTADGNDIIINAVYERLAIRYTIRYFATYYNRTGNQTYSPATKLLFTCRAFGGAYLDIIPTADPTDWEFHYHRQNVPVGSHFWAVINDNSGAPLYSTWDGTCLYRNMDLCCELWLTGDEATADYVPEETVTLVEWPDGDDMEHGHGQTPDPIKTINCTYFIGNETYLVKSYSDGTAFDNLDESSINSWLESHGQIDYYYDGWDGAPASGIVYAEDYESGSFSVTLKTKYVAPTVVCSYYVQGQLFATREYQNGNDFVSNVTNSSNVSIASYLSTNNIIGSYSWTGAPVSGKVYKADYPTRAFTVTLNWSQVNWKVEGQTVQTRKYLSNYPVYSASQDSPSAETMETYLEDNNISAEFNQWTGWPNSFTNASYDIVASVTYVTRVYIELYYISPGGIRTNVGRIRFNDDESLSTVQTAVQNFTVNTSNISWWSDYASVDSNGPWVYSSTTFQDSVIPTYAEKQIVFPNNVFFQRLDVNTGNPVVYMYTVYNLTQLNQKISTFISTYPTQTSNGVLTSKIYELNTGQFYRPFINTTSHVLAATKQTFSANTNYNFFQYILQEDTLLDVSLNGKFPPDFHYVKIFLDVDNGNGQLLSYYKWHRTGDSLPATINNTELVGYNTTASNSTLTVASDCSTNNNIFEIHNNLGNDGTLLSDGGYKLRISRIYSDYLYIHSWYAQQSGYNRSWLLS